MDVLAEIIRVIHLEQQTLSRLAEVIGEKYEETVNLIFNSPGKVVLTGMGKSGLIAQKIASTMVSTGTPAMYLHPAEAMHGDIGIVSKDDIIIAISKSGESEELTALLPTIRRIGAKLVLISANGKSSLARESDVLLLTPIVEEACPLNMAPTCSTTAALAVGDALSITLMKLRNFQPDDYALYHPGGQLGKRLLLKVGDLMRSGENNPVVKITNTAQEMLIEITSKRAGAVSVVDEANHLSGLVTDYDIRRLLEQGYNILNMTIPEIMNKSPTFVYADEKAIDALVVMERREKPFLVLPVIDRKDQVVGMVHLHDLVAQGL